MMRLLKILALLAIALQPAFGQSDPQQRSHVDGTHTDASTTAKIPTADEFTALIKQLDDDSFQTREKASKRLAGLPGEALPALEKAVNEATLSPEAAARSETALRQLQWKIDPKMMFVFDAAPVDKILADMSKSFGIVFVQSGRIGNPITVQQPNPMNEENSIKLLSNLLYPLGYATRTLRTLDGNVVIQVITIYGNGKEIPIYKGNDPKEIADNDSLITQIIPLGHLSLEQAGNILGPWMGADSDVSLDKQFNNIIITDTSAKIRRLVEFIQKLDKIESFASPGTQSSTP